MTWAEFTDPNRDQKDFCAWAVQVGLWVAVWYVILPLLLSAAAFHLYEVVTGHELH